MSWIMLWWNRMQCLARREIWRSMVLGDDFNSLAICLLHMQPLTLGNSEARTSGRLSQYVVEKVWVLNDRLQWRQVNLWIRLLSYCRR